MPLQSILRVTVFVPADKLRRVIDGVKQVYPLGDNFYDSVLWYVENAHEEFRAHSGAHPTRGRIGELHSERVSMLVFSIPRDHALLQMIMDDGIKRTHPWEKPAVFVEESWMLSSSGETAIE